MAAFLVLALGLSSLSAALKTVFKSISAKFGGVVHWVLYKFYWNFKFHYLTLGVTFFVLNCSPWCGYGYAFISLRDCFHPVWLDPWKDVSLSVPFGEYRWCHCAVRELTTAVRV